jgi:hypothetical protein
MIVYLATLDLTKLAFFSLACSPTTLSLTEPFIWKREKNDAAESAGLTCLQKPTFPGIETRVGKIDLLSI